MSGSSSHRVTASTCRRAALRSSPVEARHPSKWTLASHPRDDVADDVARGGCVVRCWCQKRAMPARGLFPGGGSTVVPSSRPRGPVPRDPTCRHRKRGFTRHGVCRNQSRTQDKSEKGMDQLLPYMDTIPKIEHKINQRREWINYYHIWTQFLK
jgi:hypothetical protein